MRFIRRLSLAYLAALTTDGFVSSSGVPTRRPLKAAVAADPDSKLKSGIAGFYDGLSGLWESVWGEHLHHGYYDAGSTKKMTLQDHQTAQIRMIDEVLAWSRVKGRIDRILDVGCGIGGASRHLARRFPGSRVTGITLSPKQKARADELSHGLPCSFKVQDALALPKEWTGVHDLVWSLESGEHMPQKPQFVRNLVKTCAPGGRVVLVTWCHRDLRPGESQLNRVERLILGIINRCYYLPKWCSVADYVGLFQEDGMTNIKRSDWTPNIAPFWPAVIQTAVQPRNFVRLLRTGVDGLRSALAMCLMHLGYRIGLIRFGLITCRKPMPLQYRYAEASDRVSKKVEKEFSSALPL